MALEQAEQLFAAAGATGSASRPLLMFYGLSQAGRALSASRLSGDWQSRGHGITQAPGNSAATTSIAGFQVEPKGAAGAFSLIARALDSSSLPGPTMLGDLWTLLPETRRFALPNGGPHRPLGIRFDPRNDALTPITGSLLHLPSRLGASHPGDGRPPGDRNVWSEQRQELTQFLSKYPGLGQYQLSGQDGQPAGLYPLGDDTFGVRIHWNLEPKSVLGLERLRRRVATEYAGHSNVYPALDSSNRPIHPLVVWWAILFGLSVLARYEPEAWGSAIDVNNSPEAIAVEHLLHTALSSVPELLYRALTQDV